MQKQQASLRAAIALSVLATTVFLKGCAEPDRVTTLPLHGDSAPMFLGDWYDFEGHRRLSIERTDLSIRAAFSVPPEDRFLPVSAEARSGSLLVRLQGPRGQPSQRLLRLVGPHPNAKGSDATLTMRGTTLVRSPPRSWRLRAKLMDSAERTVEDTAEFIGLVGGR